MVAVFTAVVLIFGQSVARAEDYLLAVQDYPPFGIHQKNGKPTGLGVDVANELSKRTGIQFKHIQPYTHQIDQLSQHQQAIFTMVTRGPDREKSLQWLGKWPRDRYCFMMKKENSHIKDLEEAKALKAIGVVQGGSSERFLQKQGFKNIESATGLSPNVRKLMAGRLDAVFATEISAPYVLKAEGIDKDKVVCVAHVDKPEIWMAASLKFNSAALAKLQEGFKAMDSEGLIEKLMKQYQP